jgi:hypothetical protein
VRILNTQGNASTDPASNVFSGIVTPKNESYARKSEIFIRSSICGVKLSLTYSGSYRLPPSPVLHANQPIAVIDIVLHILIRVVKLSILAG